MIRRALVLGLALALVVAPVAMARKYNGKIVNGNWALAGEAVSATDGTFGGTTTISYTSADDAPWVRVHCYANDTTLPAGPGLVLDARLDVFRGNLTTTLGPSPSWTGGGADCYATLLGHDAYAENPWTLLAESTFAVAP